MDTSTAFGYELENGSIRYLLTHEYSLDQIHPFLLRRAVPRSYSLTNIATCSKDFFDNFNKDNSIWRVLYCMDGTIICKKSNIPGMFSFVSDQTTGYEGSI